jgi:hypothetical protein
MRISRFEVVRILVDLEGDKERIEDLERLNQIINNSKSRDIGVLDISEQDYLEYLSIKNRTSENHKCPSCFYAIDNSISFCPYCLTSLELD